jgi:hypothetical protein
MQQQESGAIGVSQPTASKYMKLASNIARAQHMRLASNINRDLYLPETTSIRAAPQWLWSALVQQSDKTAILFVTPAD